MYYHPYSGDSSTCARNNKLHSSSYTALSTLVQCLLTVAAVVRSGLEWVAERRWKEEEEQMSDGELR